MPLRPVRLELADTPLAAEEARIATRAALDSWHLPLAVIHDAELLVSELVSNVVRHAHTTSTLEITLSARDRLRLELTDHSLRMPALVRPAPMGEGGRGLAILTAISNAWGVDVLEDGKRVWLELRIPPRAARGPYAGSATA